MPEENIGVCECIYSYEKNLLKMALERDIERTNAKIKELQNAPDSDFNEFATREKIISLYEEPKQSIKQVLNKISKIPTCGLE